MEFMYEHNDETYKIEIIKDKDDFIIKLDGRTYSLMDVLERGEGLLKFQLNRRPYKCRVAASEALRHIFMDGRVYQLKRLTPREQKTAEGGKSKAGADSAASGKIQSPINGKIIRVWVEESATVSQEQDLVIIEAMKMEHRIKSPFAGAVKKIHVKEGEQVELGSILMEMEPSKPNLKQEAE
ncbi:MAG: acetyl-CoA carboxylase biotin carboxyl carrier protein subunit [Thermoplasmata archaeon]|nr:MAG: acetyl-CoA carboxylase biotin carboxyl carrier protein subunit [Thermoplasmata archaeon]